MIVVGLPFVEILKIARDLDLPMIVMGIRGQSTPAEELSLARPLRKFCAARACPCFACPSNVQL